mgnify:CR=1 FL=1
MGIQRYVSLDAGEVHPAPLLILSAERVVRVEKKGLAKKRGSGKMCHLLQDSAQEFPAILLFPHGLCSPGCKWSHHHKRSPGSERRSENITRGEGVKSEYCQEKRYSR